MRVWRPLVAGSGESCSSRSGCAYRMVLITLPVSEARLDVLSTTVVKRFLTEMYISLGVARPEDDPDFDAMMQQLGGTWINLELLA
jgi:hypothetical protein